MQPIPDAWPPEPPLVLPLFALPNVWLFPFVVLPLHVFEERYRQMVEDILDRPGRIVVGTIREGREQETAGSPPSHPTAGSPPIHPTAGLGEIGHHERLPDGRYNVLVVGLRRVRVAEVESDRLYRKVAVQPAEEITVAPEREGELKQKLVRALLERQQRSEEPADEPDSEEAEQLVRMSVSHLADRLSLRMQLPHQVRNDLFGELDVETRARRALEQHVVRP